MMLVTSLTTSLKADIWIVPDDFQKIQWAVDSVPSGDTIYVREGIYYEHILIEEKNLYISSFYELSGDSTIIDETIIDGEFEGRCVFIQYNDGLCYIKGFTIMHGIGGQGGGVFVHQGGAVLEDLKISENVNSPAYVQGGPGIYFTLSVGKIVDCEVFGNEGNNQGGGVSIRNQSNVIMENVNIHDNIVLDLGHGKGGGLYCDINAELVVKNCFIHNNYAERWGGGVAIATEAHVTLINTTIADNDAAWGGGGLYICYSNNYVNLGNSIVYGNSPEQVYFDDCWDCYFNTLNVFYSDVEGGAVNVFLPPQMTLNWLEGNIDEDPMFREDYSLDPESPCIDTGIDLFVFQGDTLINIAENLYIGEAPDMGAYEYDPGVKIIDQESAFQIRLYPNPAKNQVYVPLDDLGQGWALIRIFDARGVVVYNRQKRVRAAGESHIEIDVIGFKSGLYYMEVLGEGNRSVGKFIKN